MVFQFAKDNQDSLLFYHLQMHWFFLSNVKNIIYYLSTALCIDVLCGSNQHQAFFGLRQKQNNEPDVAI